MKSKEPLLITVFFPPYTPYEVVLKYWSKRTNHGIDTYRNWICANPQTGLSYCEYSYI